MTLSEIMQSLKTKDAFQLDGTKFIVKKADGVAEFSVTCDSVCLYGTQTILHFRSRFVPGSDIGCKASRITWYPEKECWLLGFEDSRGYFVTEHTVEVRILQH